MSTLRKYNLKSFGIKRWVLEREDLLTMPRYRVAVIAPQENAKALAELKKVLRAKNDVLFFTSAKEFLEQASQTPDDSFCLIQIVDPADQAPFIDAEAAELNLGFYLYSTDWKFVFDGIAHQSIRSSMRALSRGFISYTPEFIECSDSDFYDDGDFETLDVPIYLLVPANIQNIPHQEELQAALEHLGLGSLQVVNDPREIHWSALHNKPGIINLVRRPVALHQHQSQFLFYIHTQSLANFALTGGSYSSWLEGVLGSYVASEGQNSGFCYYDTNLSYFYNNNQLYAYPEDEWQYGELNHQQVSQFLAQQHEASQARKLQVMQPHVEMPVPSTISTTSELVLDMASMQTLLVPPQGFTFACALIGNQPVSDAVVEQFQQFFDHRVQIGKFNNLHDVYNAIQSNPNLLVGVISEPEIDPAFLSSCNYTFAVQVFSLAQSVGSTEFDYTLGLFRHLINQGKYRHFINLKR